MAAKFLPSNFQDLSDSASQVRDSLRKLLGADGRTTLWLDIVVNYFTALYWIFAAIFTLIVMLVAVIGAAFASEVLDVVESIRDDGAEEFAAIAAKAMGEFMGVEIDPGSLATGKGAAPSAQRAQQIGGAFTSMVESLLTENGAVTPQSGADGASKFAGYMASFAASNSILNLIMEMVSVGTVKELGALGEDIARNLGLGRLSHQALAPLVRNAVSQPYDRFLRKKYRPDFIGDAELVKGIATGRWDAGDVQGFLAEKGFPDDQIEVLTQLLANKLQDSELEVLIRYGVMQLTEALTIMQQDGIPSDVATKRLQALSFKRLDGIIQAYVGIVRSQAENGFISPQAAADVLSKLPLSQDEQDWNNKLIGQRIENARKRPSLAELKKMLELAIVDLTYMDKWLADEGYSDEDQLNIQLLELSIVASDAAKAAAAKAKADAAAAKAARKAAGTPPPAPPVV